MHVTLVKSDARAREKPCLRCGYSLRKLLDAKHCPECGLSIWLSLNANDGLDWSNPRWLGRTATGAIILAGAQILGLITYVGVLVGGMRHAAWTHQLGWAGAAYAILFAAGAALFASDEGRHPDKWVGYRWGCRAAAGLGLLMAVACAGIAGKSYPAPTPLPPQLQQAIDENEDVANAVARGNPSVMASRNVTHHLDTVLEWFIILGTIAICAYLRALARRAGNSTAAKVSGWLLLLPLVSLVKSLPIVALWFARDIVALLVLLPVAFLPASAVLLGWFSIAARKAAVHATGAWAAETASPAA
jgi:hypothetical protein